MSADILRQIESLLPALSREEQLELVSRLTWQLQQERPLQPIRLEGMWKDKFPPDFDLDAALKEIRTEWEGENEDMIHGRPPR